MTFRVIARELDNGDFEPLVAFNVAALERMKDKGDLWIKKR